MIDNKYIFLSFVLFLLLSEKDLKAYADNVSQPFNRDQIVAREMECITKHRQENQPLEWEQVCYAYEDEEDFLSDRKASVTVDESGYVTVEDEGRNSHGFKKTRETMSEEKPDWAETEDVSEEDWAAVVNRDDDLFYHEEELFEADQRPLLEEGDLEEELLRELKSQGAVKSGLFDREDPLNLIEFGTETSYIHYRETGIMRQKGAMYGIFGAYTHRFSENQHIRSLQDIFSGTNKINMFRFDGKFSYGWVDYSSERTGEDEGIRDYLLEARAVAGYDLPFWPASRLTPYLGIGYRYLNDDSAGRRTTTGHFGYERESRYVYIPLGLEFSSDRSNNWTVGVTTEYDIFLGGKQLSHLGDAVAGLNTVENEQRDGWGFRGAVRLMKRNENIDFFFEPFMRYWKIDDSEISLLTYQGVAVGYGLEPENKSTEYGLKLGFNY